MPIMCLLAIFLCAAMSNVFGVAGIIFYPIILLGTSIILPQAFKKIGFFYNALFVCGLYYTLFFPISDTGYISSEFCMLVTFPLLVSLFTLMMSYTQTVWTTNQTKDIEKNR